MFKGWVRLFSIVSVFLLVCSLFIPVRVWAEDETSTSKILISSVKTDGGSGSEFVELYNPGDSLIDLSGWKLEYIQASLGLTEDVCSSTTWSSEQQISKYISLDLAGQSIAPLTRLKLFLSSMNDDAAGAVRLSQFKNQTQPNPELIIHDLVGWGSDALPAPCSEQQAANIPKDAQKLERCVDNHGYFMDTNNNLQDFKILSDAEALPQLCDAGQDPANDPDCSGVVVSEVLPNPKGDDQNSEFIEIFNPTAETINLSGCKLQVEGSANIYEFEKDEVIESGQFIAIYSEVSGLRLPNASGGTVLIISGGVEYPFSYQPGLKDDISWAMIDEKWQMTDRPTPGSTNLPMSQKPSPNSNNSSGLKPCAVGKYRNPETNRCRNIETTSDSLKPCAEGKERNPATNRCRSIVASLSSLVPCRDGQVRNPETNRCRSVLSSSSSLVPCKPGQQRNPETNRCRKIDSDGSSLKPCAEGQERNPETNRCRKVKAQLASADFGSESNNSSPINYGILAAVGSLVAGYGVYEYRNDFRNKWRQIRNHKFFNRSGR